MRRTPWTVLTVAMLGSFVVAYELCAWRFGSNLTAAELARWGGVSRDTVTVLEPGRILTAALLVPGPVSLLKVLLVVAILGRPIERAVGAIGLTAVLAAGVYFAALGAVLLQPDYMSMTADGVAYSLAAFAVLHREDLPGSAGLRRLGACLVVVGLAEAAVRFDMTGSSFAGGASWGATVGGMVGGALAATIVRRGPKVDQPDAPRD